MDTADRLAGLRAASMRTASALYAWIYRRSNGKLLGRFPGGAPVCLLTTRGRKSGQRRTVPLLYLRDGEDWVVVASHAGAPQHPGWYRNLEADPHAELEIGAERIPVHAQRVSEDEKARLWPRLIAIYPAYDKYQRKTPRAIPVVRLTRA